VDWAGPVAIRDGQDGIRVGREVLGLDQYRPILPGDPGQPTSRVVVLLHEGWGSSPLPRLLSQHATVVVLMTPLGPGPSGRRSHGDFRVGSAGTEDTHRNTDLGTVLNGLFGVGDDPVRRARPRVDLLRAMADSPELAWPREAYLAVHRAFDALPL